jgi:indole-3-glycerol phosphate synthase
MILDKIVEHRKIQLHEEMALIGRQEMIDLAMAVDRKKRSLKTALSGEGLSVIAEVKKASPSKGLIQADYQPALMAGEYERHGASAVSVLTESTFFLGSAEDLKQVRHAVNLPILRKDFIFDPYQIYEARVIGADAVLLIVGILDDSTLKSFMKLADDLSMDTLVEVHDEEELKRGIACGASLIGINNRNLKTFEVSLDSTRRLIQVVPEHCLCVSESGISTATQMASIHQWGADGVLIGEALMRSLDVGETLRSLRPLPDKGQEEAREKGREESEN